MEQESARGEADVHSQLHVGPATAEEGDEGGRWEGEGGRLRGTAGVREEASWEAEARGAEESGEEGTPGLGALLAQWERQGEEELEQMGILPLIRAHPLLAVGVGVGVGVLLAGGEGGKGSWSGRLRAALLGMATARLLEQVEGRFGLSEAQVRAIAGLLASRQGREAGGRGRRGRAKRTARRGRGL